MHYNAVITITAHIIFNLKNTLVITCTVSNKDSRGRPQALQLKELTLATSRLANVQLKACQDKKKSAFPPVNSNQLDYIVD